MTKLAGLTLSMVMVFMLLANSSAAATVAMPGDYASQPARLIVPVAAGAAVDMTARAVVDALGRDLGTGIMVENLAGASQTIGATEFSNRAATGWNLCVVANACAFTQPVLTKLKYDVADWRIIANLAPMVRSVLTAASRSDLKTVDDVIARIKSGKRIVIGVNNVVSITHLSALELIDGFNCTNCRIMNYDGAPELIAAMLSGEIDCAMIDDATLYPYTQSGELNALLCMSEVALADYFPGVAYMGQYDKDFVACAGIKFLAVLKGTPDEYVEWIKQQVNAALASEKYQKFLVNNGFGAMPEILTEEEVQLLFNNMERTFREIMSSAGMVAGS